MALDDDERRKNRLRLGWEIDGKSQKYVGADIITDEIQRQKIENDYLGSRNEVQHYRTNHKIEEEAHTPEDFRGGIDDVVMPTQAEANQNEPATLQQVEHNQSLIESVTEAQDSNALQTIEDFGQRVAAKSFAREQGFESLQKPEGDNQVSANVEPSENPEPQHGRFLYLCQNAEIPDAAQLHKDRETMLANASQDPDPLMANREVLFASEIDNRMADLGADYIYRAHILNDDLRAQELEEIGLALTDAREEGFQQLANGEVTLDDLQEQIEPYLGEIISEVGHPDLENLDHPIVDYSDPALEAYKQAIERGEVVQEGFEAAQEQRDEERLESIQDEYHSQDQDFPENEISGVEQRTQQNTKDQEEQAEQEAEGQQVQYEAHEDNSPEQTDRRQLNFAERVAEKAHVEAKDQTQSEKGQSQENDGNGGMS